MSVFLERLTGVGIPIGIYVRLPGLSPDLGRLP